MFLLSLKSSYGYRITWVAPPSRHNTSLLVAHVKT